MSELLVQSFLRTHSFRDLSAEHGVYATLSASGRKASLTYDQIEARESDPLACQCRGLVIGKTNGEVIDPQAPLGDTVVLARPFDRFFNHGQQGMDAGHLVGLTGTRVYEKADGCFTRETRLNCWDGSTVRIGDVVSRRLTPVLVGRDGDGMLVPCAVTNWFNNGTKDRWMDIVIDGPTRALFPAGGHPCRMRVTINHELFLNGTFQPAIAARPGDSMLAHDRLPDASTIHVVRAGLLGDGTLCKNGRHGARYEEGHKKDHTEYVYAVHRWLGGIGGRVSVKMSGYGTTMQCIASLTSHTLEAERLAWYPNDGMKRVPNDLTWVDDFAVAKWYMDDGSLDHHESQQDRARFATNCFPYEDVARLAEKLTQLYGVQCCVANTKGWTIRVNAGRDRGIERMWAAIAPHIVPCMRYKLPEQYRCVAHIERQPGSFDVVSRERKIVSTTQITDLTKKTFSSGRVGFDIATTTGNYFANGVLVHNSLTIVYYDTYAGAWCVATRGTPDADRVISSWTSAEEDRGTTFRGLFERALADMGLGTFEQFTGTLDPAWTFLYELTTPYNQVVVRYERPCLWHLGARHTMGGNETYPEVWASAVPPVPSYPCNTFMDLLDVASALPPSEREGLVVVSRDFLRVKVKSPAYVAVHGLKDSVGSSPRRMMELILLGREDDAFPLLPEVLRIEGERMRDNFRRLCHEMDSAYDRVITEAIGDSPRKAMALAVQREKLPIAPMMARFVGQCASFRGWVDARRQPGGSWPDPMIDNLLEWSSGQRPV